MSEATGANIEALDAPAWLPHLGARLPRLASVVGVIALDTDQLHQMRHDGPSMRMLQRVAAETGHKLILPEMVETEYFAHYRHEVEAAVSGYQKAAADLQRLFPQWSAPAVPGSLCDSAEQDRRNHLKAIFSTYQTPEGTAREALIREAHRRPPTKTSWDTPGSGARDAVIWLTLIDACRTGGEKVYFVTNNSTDFGKSDLRVELLEDLETLLGPERDLFSYCTSIPALLTKLDITESQGPDAATIGSSRPVIEAIEAVLSDEGPAGFEFVEAIPNLAMKFVRLADRVEDLNFTRPEDRTMSYATGHSTWACIRGIWSGSKRMSVLWRPELISSARHQELRQDFTVAATVIMQLDDEVNVISAEVTDRSRVKIIRQSTGY